MLAEFAAGRARKPIAIRLMPDLQGENCEAMSRLVLNSLRGSSRDLELDLSNVGYLPSCAVGCVVAFYAELSQTGRKLILTNVSDQVFEVFDLAGVTALPFQNLEIRRQVYGRRRAARK
jgi:anti-anti-sigma factor